MKNRLNNRDALIAKLQENKKKLVAFGVEEIGLFGSFSTGNETEDSDIDILVNLKKNKKTFRNFLSLNYFLEHLFGKKVDLVTKQSLSPFIGPHILKSTIYVPLND